jgi:hypothetical protein
MVPAQYADRGRVKHPRHGQGRTQLRCCTRTLPQTILCGLTVDGMADAHEVPDLQSTNGATGLATRPYLLERASNVIDQLLSV